MKNYIYTNLLSFIGSFCARLFGRKLSPFGTCYTTVSCLLLGYFMSLFAFHEVPLLDRCVYVTCTTVSCLLLGYFMSLFAFHEVSLLNYFEDLNLLLLTDSIERLDNRTLKGHFSYALGSLGVFLTAFYSTRLTYSTFLSTPNGYKSVIRSAYDSSYQISISSFLLVMSSVLIGFYAKDMLIGFGSGF